MSTVLSVHSSLQYFCPQFFQMRICAHTIKTMSKIRLPACAHPQPLLLLDLPSLLEYVPLRNFGLSPLQTLFVTLLGVIHNNELQPLTVIICQMVCQLQKRVHLFRRWKLESYDDPENGNYINYDYYTYYVN